MSAFPPDGCVTTATITTTASCYNRVCIHSTGSCRCSPANGCLALYRVPPRPPKAKKVHHAHLIERHQRRVRRPLKTGFKRH